MSFNESTMRLILKYTIGDSYVKSVELESKFEAINILNAGYDGALCERGNSEESEELYKIAKNAVLDVLEYLKSQI